MREALSSCPHANRPSSYTNLMCAMLLAPGVCLFTLLSGYLPFDPSGSASPDEQRHRVHSGRPAFSAEDGGHPRQWEQISPSARDLIRHMLCIDPSKRITPAEIVACRWVSGAASAEVLPGSDKQLQRFNAARRIWRTAAGAVALVIGAPATAAAINAEQDTIALDELVANIGEPGLQVPPARAPPTQQLPPAALVEMRAVFRAFDEDGDGYIDERELSAAMQSLGAGEENAEKMLRSAGLPALLLLLLRCQSPCHSRSSRYQSPPRFAGFSTPMPTGGLTSTSSALVLRRCTNLQPPHSVKPSTFLTRIGAPWRRASAI